MKTYHVWGQLDPNHNDEENVQEVRVHAYEGDVADAVNTFKEGLDVNFNAGDLHEVRDVDGYLREAYFTRLTSMGEIEWHRFVEPSGPYEEEEWDE